ncbi:efflux RND transporter periplasmic adaptor subunit [Pedobacter helvus]|uniref:Efflux RND transporter periplasmic adaptor subunit n=1 Tax=Pedobacter helvus TaxID=2563444 RepID=A0ABW9JJ83_9SPHI|nr:efflux RND transporter periplasmic adaptor subunit [Pedobacter ureilyticus]
MINRRFDIPLVKGSISLLFASLMVSCGNPEQAPLPPTEVPVAKVKNGTGTVKRQYPTSLQGVVTVDVRAQVSGYISKIHVDEGAYVKAGQILFTIDPRSYQEQFNTANAAILVAKANLTTAKIELNRKKELVANKIVSDLQVQQAQAAFESANASLSQAQAAAQAARINYEFCTVKAPVSGYISRIPYRLGSLINPASAAPLTVLSDIHKVYAYFSMSENDFIDFQKSSKGGSITEKIKNAAPVQLEVSDGSLYAQEGKIDAIDGQFDRSTGSVVFRAVFDNPKGLLRDGNTGKVIITKKFEQSVLVPITATVTIQDKSYIYTVDKEGKVKQLPIEIAGKSGSDYMVSSGIAAGDIYIVSGFERLQPGMQVKTTASNTLAKN